MYKDIGDYIYKYNITNKKHYKNSLFLKFLKKKLKEHL